MCGVRVRGSPVVRCLPGCRPHFIGDFAGATKLVSLMMKGNRIVSVSVEAFGNLHALQFKPEDFKPTNADGSPYAISFGAGTCTVALV